MKILCIGNSFSEDATRYLEQLSNGAMKVRNAYIGGCSLERHVSNIGSNEKEYIYQESTSAIDRVSLDQAIRADAWDIVTVQQSSPLSGIPDSYEPFLGQLVAHIHTLCPGAEIVFHETWAYESTSTHQAFPTYHCDRVTMENAIESTVPSAVAPYHLPILNVGRVIASVRRTPVFDVTNGGISITRDGFHLSFLYGRYVAGLAWLRFFTGADATKVDFSPELSDPAIIALLQKTVNETVTPLSRS